MAVTKTKKFIECRQCGDKMDLITVKRHSAKWPATFVALGATCTLFIGGPILGVPLMLLGVYQYTSKQTVSYCPSCGYHYRVFMSESD
ncbi:MAG: hypothetical protein HQK68_00155 [Desulfamplus sp.]|nr:hypothetical protein [Desulfamplus sp.]